MSKAIGAEIKDFYDNHFPAGHYHDDTAIETHGDSGEWLLEDAKQYDLGQLGVLVDEKNSSECVSFESGFKKWQRSKTVTTVLVEIPTTSREEAIERIKKLGYKVKSV